MYSNDPTRFFPFNHLPSRLPIGPKGSISLHFQTSTLHNLPVWIAVLLHTRVWPFTLPCPQIKRHVLPTDPADGIAFTAFAVNLVDHVRIDRLCESGALSLPYVLVYSFAFQYNCHTPPPSCTTLRCPLSAWTSPSPLSRTTTQCHQWQPRR